MNRTRRARVLDIGCYWISHLSSRSRKVVANDGVVVDEHTHQIPVPLTKPTLSQSEAVDNEVTILVRNNAGVGCIHTAPSRLVEVDALCARTEKCIARI